MATEFDTVQSQYQNYRFCYDNGHSDWLRTAKTCFDFYSNKQWDPKDKAKLEREGRPALTLNVIESLVRSMQGIHRSLRNDVRFVPVADASMADATLRNQTWLHIQQQNDFDYLESHVFKKGLIMGRAYYDTRMKFDENLQGEVCITSPRSQDVVLHPSVDEYSSKTWPEVFIRRWVSANDIEAQFGKDKAKHIMNSPIPDFYDYEDTFMAQQMGNLPYYQHHHIDTMLMPHNRGHLLLDRQYIKVKRKEHFIDLKTGDTSEIPENWERNRIAAFLEKVPGVSTIKRDVKTICWAVTAGGIVLHEEDSPYKNFTIVPFFPSFIDGITMGAVESLIDPQRMYNKVTSQELHIINTTANSGWKVRRGSLKNMTIQELEQVGAKSGFVAELDDIAQMEKITPNSTPQGHDRLSFKADAIMRNLSGISNQGRGFAREDVAGEAIMANQAAQDINFADWLSNLHYSKVLVARNCMDLAQTYYTETREIMINRGTALAPEMESVVLNQPAPQEQGMPMGAPDQPAPPPTLLNDMARGKYSCVLVPSPMRTSMAEGDFKLLLELRQLGIGIDDKLLIELSPAINKTQIMDKLVGDSNQQQAAAAAAAERIAELEAALTQAKAEKEASAAKLNSARADKFAVEAVSDPDASYERIEQQRIEREDARDLQRIELQHQKQVQDYDVAKEANAIKREQAKRSASSPPKKPAPQKRK